MSILASWLLLVGAAACTCIGNLMLKQSRLATADSGVLVAGISPWFLFSLIFFCVNLIMFSKALDKVPMSVAIPVAQGLTFVFTMIMANRLFSESFGFKELIASSFIMAGIVVMSHQ
jgi:multidrug transporter EmrE-like cation transporter